MKHDLMKYAFIVVLASLMQSTAIAATDVECFDGMGPGESEVTAHGGGTDSNGCHYNRKTGEYHCH